MRLACSLVWALAGAASTRAKIVASATRIGVLHILFFIAFCSSFDKPLIRGRKILPKPPSACREYIHSPREAWLHGTVDLQSLKQVLCQPVGTSVNSQKTIIYSITCYYPVVAFLYADMSSACRRFGTRIMAGRHKLLIRKRRATVAEGRQGGGRMSHPGSRIHHIGLSCF